MRESRGRGRRRREERGQTKDERETLRKTEKERERKLKKEKERERKRYSEREREREGGREGGRDGGKEGFWKYLSYFCAQGEFRDLELLESMPASPLDIFTQIWVGVFVNAYVLCA